MTGGHPLAILPLTLASLARLWHARIRGINDRRPPGGPGSPATTKQHGPLDLDWGRRAAPDRSPALLLLLEQSPHRQVPGAGAPLLQPQGGQAPAGAGPPLRPDRLHHPPGPAGP